MALWIDLFFIYGDLSESILLTQPVFGYFQVVNQAFQGGSGNFRYIPIIVIQFFVYILFHQQTFNIYRLFFIKFILVLFLCFLFTLILLDFLLVIFFYPLGDFIEY